MSRDSLDFPDIMTWATSVEGYTLPPLTLSLPKSAAPSEMTSDGASTADFIPSDVLDPTTLSYNYNWTSLHGLDDQLLYCPTIAFAELCYHEAVDNAMAVERVSVSTSSSTATPIQRQQSVVDSTVGAVTPKASPQANPWCSAPQAQGPSSQHQHPANWSDESDSDTDECRTCDDGEIGWYSNGDISDAHPVVGDFAQVEPGSSIIFFDQTAPPPPLLPESTLRAGGVMEEDRSFILFEPYSYSHSHRHEISVPSRPEESVGYFPIPNDSTKNKSTKPNSSRIAALVSKFPGRRPTARSQNPWHVMARA